MKVTEVSAESGGNRSSVCFSKEEVTQRRPFLPSISTMSIYTVRECSGDAKPHKHLEERGMNAKSVTATSLDPLALADFPQIAYHLYTKLIPAFMVCCSLL